MGPDGMGVPREPKGDYMNFKIQEFRIRILKRFGFNGIMEYSKIELYYHL